MSCRSSYLAVLLSILFVGTAASAGGVPLVIEHGPRNEKKIALTFDACPTSREHEYDEKVVEVLLREKVPATLFMSGRWVEKNAETAQLLASNPQFEIGNHAYWHPHLLEKNDDRVLRELTRTQSIVGKVTGVRPKYFRPPFGEVDERVANLAEKAGLLTIQYDVASGDPDPALSADRIARGVVGSARNGSIVVFHMNGNGVHTDEVLPVVIRELRQKGYEFVTVGEMLKGMDRGAGRGKDSGRRGEADPEKGRGKERKGSRAGRLAALPAWQSSVCH